MSLTRLSCSRSSSFRWPCMNAMVTHHHCCTIPSLVTQRGNSKSESRGNSKSLPQRTPKEPHTVVILSFFSPGYSQGEPILNIASRLLSASTSTSSSTPTSSSNGRPPQVWHVRPPPSIITPFTLSARRCWPNPPVSHSPSPQPCRDAELAVRVLLFSFVC